MYDITKILLCFSQPPNKIISDIFQKTGERKFWNLYASTCKQINSCLFTNSISSGSAVCDFRPPFISHHGLTLSTEDRATPRSTFSTIGVLLYHRVFHQELSASPSICCSRCWLRQSQIFGKMTLQRNGSQINLRSPISLTRNPHRSYS